MKPDTIASLAVCLLLTGCVTREPLNTDPAFPGAGNTLTRPPIGRFAVQGAASDPETDAPNLCAYFFRDFLRGFDIDNIAILATEDSNRVLVQPYVGAIPVAESLVLEARPQKDGSLKWGMVTPKGEALATQILGPPMTFLASMGTTVFLYGNEETELLTDEEGALLICYNSTGVGIGLLAPRVVYSNKIWYRYPVFPPLNPNDDPANRQVPVEREK